MHKQVCPAICGFIAALLCVPTYAANPDTSALFDKPLHEAHIRLKTDRANQKAEAMLSCFYYPHLMIKQIYMGEKGSEQLSMISIGKGQNSPKCRKQNAKDEKVVTSWSGYFKGVKGDYVFFDGDDSQNGGMPFGVYTSSGNSLYEDNAIKMDSIELLSPPRDPDLRPWYENPLKLRYKRAYIAPCSLRADGSHCWEIIRDATGLTGSSSPDCKEEYAQLENEAPPEQRKQASEDPSVVIYDVEAVLDGRGAIRITPISQAGACHPAD